MTAEGALIIQNPISLQFSTETNQINSINVEPEANNNEMEMVMDNINENDEDAVDVHIFLIS